MSDFKPHSARLRIKHRATQKELKASQNCSSSQHGFLAVGTHVSTIPSLSNENLQMCRGLGICGCTIVFEISSALLDTTEIRAVEEKPALPTPSAQRLQPRDFNLADEPISFAIYSQTLVQRLAATSWISTTERSLLTALVNWANSPDDETAKSVLNLSKEVTKEFRSKVEVDFSELLVPLFAWRKSCTPTEPAWVKFPLEQNHAAHDFCIKTDDLTTWHSVKGGKGVTNTFKPVQLLEAIRKSRVPLLTNAERKLVDALKIIQKESIEDGGLKVLLAFWPEALCAKEFDPGITVEGLVQQYDADELRDLLAPLFHGHQQGKSEFEGSKENVAFLCNRQAKSKLNAHFGLELTRLFKAALMDQGTGLWNFKFSDSGGPYVDDLTSTSPDFSWQVEFRSKNSMKRCRDRLGFQVKFGAVEAK